MRINKLTRNIIGSISLIICLITIYLVISLNMVPDKYLFVFIVAELIIMAVSFIFINLKRRHYKILKIIGIILFIISAIFNLFCCYYLNNTNKFIDSGFTGTYVETTKYYLVGNKNSDSDEISDDSEVYNYKYSRSIDKAKGTLGDYKYIDTDNVSDTLWKISGGSAKYLLISEANYNYLMDSTNQLKREDYKIIKEFNVTEVIKRNNKVKDVYTIYVAGLDFTGIMRDYNMLITVNNKTHKIVMTSIPRDYYIDVPDYNMKDTLMCLGSVDSEVSKKALEKLFDTKIDYVVNLNTNNLVEVVDMLGGLEFCSDYDFTTTHALVNGTYDDSKGEKLHVSKGCHNYNGIEILTIARERNAFPGRDRVRQANCRKIAISIGNKLVSTSTISNYNEVLKSFDNLYKTDMNKKVITNLFKSILSGNKYSIIEQSVDGSDGIGIGHLGTQESWIMNPDMNTVNSARDKIKNIRDGK